ncbi:MAG: helix-turn-helix transcriptional regulator [Candidatus Aminicenantes bacterium]|nr:MAG: helix-turn-helix transcriptional regulator [Candidatus Aminicenantes bacterium]
MREALKKEIGHRIRKVRKTLGYTQERMVSFFDIGRANYSRIEQGKVWPRTPILHTLRTKFNVSLDWLIANIGKMFIRHQDKKEYEKTVSGEYAEEVKELLKYLEKVPMVKHAMLSYFLEYKTKHQKIIQQFLDESEFSVPYTMDVNANSNE